MFYTNVCTGVLIISCFSGVTRTSSLFFAVYYILFVIQFRHILLPCPGRGITSLLLFLRFLLFLSEKCFFIRIDGVGIEGVTRRTNCKAL